VLVALLVLLLYLHRCIFPLKKNCSKLSAVRDDLFAFRISDQQRQDSLYLSSKLRIVEVRSAALFFSAQAQFRSQLTADYSAIFLVAQVAEMRIAVQAANPPASA
jgi:hypothetical protein